MKNELTVVMYHYVRNLKESRFPNLKGLDSALFREQIKQFSQNYQFVTIEDVIAFYEEGKPLPTDSRPPILLTFDDGYKDCYTYALPILEEFGAKGAFFIPVSNYVNKSLLEVNKIHLLLESVSVDDLTKEIRHFLEKSSSTELDSFETYYNTYAQKSRYDSEEVIFVKRMLQKALPKEVRTDLITSLFNKYIPVKESVLSEELYMSIDQLAFMKRLGHHIGFHTYNHYWLNELSPDDQLEEFEKPIAFFKENGIFDDKMTIAYPYGAYNEDTLAIAQQKGFKLAFTVEPRLTILGEDSPLELPRFDTNDFL